MLEDPLRTLSKREGKEGVKGLDWFMEEEHIGYTMPNTRFLIRGNEVSQWKKLEKSMREVANFPEWNLKYFMCDYEAEAGLEENAIRKFLKTHTES